MAKHYEVEPGVFKADGRSSMLFEAINWSQVADSLEQTTLDYAAQAIGKDSSSGVAYASAALVIDALKRALREGLE